jgi:hypothetical protein
MPLSGALFSIHEVIKHSKKLEKSECKKELPIKHAQYRYQTMCQIFVGQNTKI